MLQAYRAHVAERAKLGIPLLALDDKQVAELIEIIKNWHLYTSPRPRDATLTRMPSSA